MKKKQRKKIKVKSKMIKRVHRISYFRKDGTYVKHTSTRVKSANVLPGLKAGGLRRFGYSVTKTLKERRNALLRALINGKAKSNMVRRLSAISTFTKRTHPASSLRYRMDCHWLSKM